MAAKKDFDGGRVVRARLYPDGAELTRSLRVDDAEGQVCFVLGPLPRDVEAAKIRAQAWTVAPPSLPLELNPMTLVPRSASDATRVSRHILKQLADEESADAHDRALLCRFGELTMAAAGRAWAEGNLSEAWLHETFDALRKKRASLETRAALREKQRARLALEAEEHDSVGAYEARVLAQLPPGYRGPVATELTYFTRSARWRPLYEVQLKPSDVHHRVHLTLTGQACVEQHSSEEWTSVELSFSTGAPQRFEAPPALAPRVVGRKDFEPGFTDSGVEAEAPLAVPTELQGPHPADLPSGHPARLELFAFNLEARPRIEIDAEETPCALRLVELVNPLGHALPPGPVHVVGEFGPLRTSKLPFVPAGGRIKLGLAPLGELHVTRALDAHSKTADALTGIYTYDLERRTTVENVGRETLEVTLLERIPSSLAPELDVRILGMDHALDLDPKTGLGRLSLSLPPRTRREVRVSFRISATHPLDIVPPHRE